MKKNFKKFASILIAGVMTLGMSVTALAEGATLSGGMTGSSGTALSEGVVIKKEIVFVNAESTNVREPNITYEYTVDAVMVDSTTTPTVTDSNNTVVSVKSGVLEANTNENHKASVSFSDTTKVENVVSTGTADSKTFTLTFDASKFSAAGVYRYSVTESIATGSNSKATVGISPTTDYKDTRYLDVYVEWDSTHDNLEIYGYVLFESDAATTESITGSKSKSQGWVDTDTSDTNHSDVDVYTTQNLYLNKSTTGAMADKTQLFTLTYTATLPSTVTATVKIDSSITDGGAITNQQSADGVGTYINSSDFAKTGGNTVTVKDGTVVAFKGIPAGGTVTVTEKNDSRDSYKVKAGKTTGTEDLLTEAVVAAGASTSSGTASQNLTDTVKIYFTNTLDAPSPTRVILTFAPYVLIFAFALALLFMSSKRRRAV